MMAYFVGYHVCLRKITLRSEAPGELVVERKVDVHTLVDGAIKWTRLRLTRAAAGVGCAREQHQLGVAIALSVLSKQLLPGVLRVVEHERDEVARGIAALGRNSAASN